MRIREAKVAVDQEWNKLKIRQFGNNSKSETKKEVIEEAQKEGNTIHVATVMDVVPPQKFRIGQ